MKSIAKKLINFAPKSLYDKIFNTVWNISCDVNQQCFIYINIHYSLKIELYIFKETSHAEVTGNTKYYFLHINFF